MVLFEDEAGNGLDFSETTRFQVAFGSNAIQIIKSNSPDRFSYGQKGMWLYYSKNYFGKTPFKKSIFRSSNFPNYSGSFFPYSKDRPENTSEDHEGIGWKITSQHEKNYSAVLGLHVYSGSVAQKYFYYGFPQGSIDYKYLHTTYNNLRLSPHEIKVISSNQVLSKQSATQANIGKAVTDSVFNYVDCNVISTTFMVDYGDQTAPRFEIVTPNKTIINPSLADDSNIFYTHQPELNTIFYTVIFPEPGRWHVKINDSYSIDTTYKFVFPMQVQNFLQLEVDTNPDDSLSFLLSASLSDSTVTIDELEITGAWNTTDVGSGSMTFNDQGIYPDTLGNDGVYAAIFSPPNPGEYFIKVSATGDSGGGGQTIKRNDCSFYRETTTVLSQSLLEINTATEDKRFNETNKSRIELFPNPTAGTLTVRFMATEPQPWMLSIYNSVGQSFTGITGAYDNQTMETQIDVSDLPAGLYYAAVQNINGQTLSKRFIKK